MLKALHAAAEKNKTAIRNIRQQARNDVKKEAKTDKWSSDEEAQMEKQVTSS